MGETVSLEERYAKIMGFFQGLGGTALLVFDNIEDPTEEGLMELTRLPDTVKVIANSRCQVPGFDGRELDFLSEKTCMELFYRYYDVETDEEGVKELVGRSARHTLTVELLARTAQNAGLRVRDLVRWMKEKGFNLNEVIGDKVETSWHEVKDRRLFFDHLRGLLFTAERFFIINIFHSETSALSAIKKILCRKMSSFYFQVTFLPGEYWQNLLSHPHIETNDNPKK